MKKRLYWGLAVVAGLVEANGTPLKLRGINHAHTWYPNQTSSFASIKAAGANSVRVVLSGGRWQPANGAVDVANVINLCKANRLICVLENHDTTGFGEQGGAVSLDAAVDYWISVQSALTGQENYVILNIGNEPFGNNAVTPGWTQATISAIQRLRNAGFEHTIMVDAPNWGQDWQFTMRANTTYRYRVRATNAAGRSAYSVITNATTGGASAGCTATFRNINQWPGGFQGEVTVTNAGSTPTTGWSVVVTFTDGQQINQIWGGRTTLGSNPYTVVNETWNATLGPSASTSFGFIASWSGTNSAPALTCSRTP